MLRIEESGEGADESVYQETTTAPTTPRTPKSGPAWTRGIAVSALSVLALSLLVVVPCLLLSHGWRSLGGCPLQPRVPVFLLVSGLLSLSFLCSFTGIVAIAAYRSSGAQFAFQRLREEGSLAAVRPSRNVGFLAGAYFVTWLAWTVLGSYWLFTGASLTPSVAGAGGNSSLVAVDWAARNGTAAASGCPGSSAAVEWLSLSYFLLFVGLLCGLTKACRRLCAGSESGAAAPKYSYMNEDVYSVNASC